MASKSAASNAEGNLSSCKLCGKILNKRSIPRHMLMHTGERKYECDICGILVVDKASLVRHQVIHTGEKNFQCHLCQKRFSQKCTLQKHLLYHSGERRYKCEICGKTLVEKCHLKRHMLRHDPNAQKCFTCDTCAKVFKRKVDLVNHMVKHTIDRNIECDVCGKSVYRNYFPQHLRQHGIGKNHKCQVCGKLFSHTSTLARHMVNHSQEKDHVCDVCCKRFATKCSLMRHRPIHLQQGEGGRGEQQVHDLKGNVVASDDLEPIAEVICDSLKDAPVGTYVDINSSGETTFGKKKKRYTCEKCGKTFSQRGTLRRHRDIHASVKKHACDYCGKRFADRASMRRHRQIHTREENGEKFPCEICHKEFPGKTHLYHHMRNHTDKKDYKCEVCGKEFNMKIKVRRHLVTHSNKKDCRCEICGIEYAKELDLMRHMVVHTGQRIYECLPCEKSFPRKSLLNKHHLTVHGDFNCEKCDDERFPSFSALAEHMEKHLISEGASGVPGADVVVSSSFKSDASTLYEAELNFAQVENDDGISVSDPLEMEVDDLNEPFVPELGISRLEASSLVIVNERNIIGESKNAVIIKQEGSGSGETTGIKEELVEENCTIKSEEDSVDT